VLAQFAIIMLLAKVMADVRLQGGFPTQQLAIAVFGALVGVLVLLGLAASAAELAMTVCASVVVAAARLVRAVGARGSAP
jgi:hypothetical protein